MKLSKQQLSDIIYTPVIKDELDRLASKARAELAAGNLEIEGYERVQWTRFDPNDPKTYPPKGWFLGYVAGTIVQLLRHPDETDEYFANKFSIKNHLTHWRPLPNDPVETEETK